MAQLALSGQITQSPANVCGAGTVPSGVVQIPLATTPNPKNSNRMAKGSRYLSSPSSFQAISGIGASDDVTTADFLYLKCDQPVQVQLTQQNLSGGGPVASVVNVYGTLFCEFPVGGYLTGLAAQGTANLEFIVSGPA